MATRRIPVERLSETLSGVMEKFHTLHAQEMAIRTVQRSPVDTGNLRGSITLSQGSPDVRDGIPDASGGSTINRIKTKKLKINKITYITAGADYAGVIEQGSSQQAPSGFMRITAMEAQLHANRVARDL